MEEYDFWDTYKDDLLDRYLEFGWFRMLHFMFTTDNIEKENQTFPVFWLRYQINKINFNKKHRQLNNSNKNFTVTIKPLIIDTEIEELFINYKKTATFMGYKTIAEAFETGLTVFDTYVITIRNNNQLIACGFFDKGKNAIAGIMNIYHPDYKKYSLGKYLLMQKINYCIVNNIPLYYPGYLVPGLAKFDYKLYPDVTATEVYVQTLGIWISYNDWLFNKQTLVI